MQTFHSRAEEIQWILNHQFTPSVLTLVNESHLHHTDSQLETHFNLTLVSSCFAEQTRVARHQSVYRCLKPVFAQGVHALSLHLFTPEEWDEQAALMPASPQCRGGYHAS
ncbi:MAG: BolA family transcriptional regulator [Gammaproteobacteria bacterium]|nr:BolA family transcriptional regulator [Gammaproteobacteria bacterium]